MRPLLLHEARIVQALLAQSQTGSDWQVPRSIDRYFFPEHSVRTQRIDFNRAFTLFFGDTTSDPELPQRVAHSRSIPHICGGDLFLVGDRATRRLAFLDYFSPEPSEAPLLRPYAEAVAARCGAWLNTADQRPAATIVNELTQAVDKSLPSLLRARCARLLVISDSVCFFVSEDIELLTSVQSPLWIYETDDGGIQVLVAPDRQVAVEGWIRLSQ